MTRSSQRRKKKSALTPATLAALGGGAALGFTGLTFAISRHKPSRLDRRVWSYFPEFNRPRAARRGASGIGRLGKTWMHGPAALAAAAYVWPRTPAGALMIVLSSAAGSALGHAFERLLTPRLAPPGRLSLTEPSYPSGHSLRATAVSMVTASILIRERSLAPRAVLPLAIAIPLGVGVSRVYLDKHWATDVVGGWLAGIVLGAGCLAAYDRVR